MRDLKVPPIEEIRAAVKRMEADAADEIRRYRLKNRLARGHCPTCRCFAAHQQPGDVAQGVE